MGCDMRRRSIALMSQTAMLLASGKKGGNAEATPSKKKKKKKKKNKGEQPQWFGVAKGLKTGAWYDTYSAIKPLVHGVKPALYEGFPTEAEAWDFVENHRDHHEGAKQKSVWKTHNAEWEGGRTPVPTLRKTMFFSLCPESRATLSERK